MRRLGLLACVAVLWSTTTVFAEDITLTTYYPSPRGVYKELRTTDDTFLATQGGHVLIGTTIVPATDPKVHVVGPVEADAFRAFEQSGAYAFLEGNAGNPLDHWVAIGGFDLSTSTYADTFVDGRTLALQTRSGGNVGIGTATPSATLHIRSSDPVVGNIYFGDLSEDMAFDGGSDSYFPFVHKGNPAGSTAFCYLNSGTRLMTISNNGNVNIGPTSDPANVRALTVSGKVNVNDVPAQRGNIDANDVHVRDASGGNAKWLSGTVTKVGIIIHSNSVPGNDAGACLVLGASWEPDPVPQVGGLLAASVGGVPSTTEHAHVCVSRK